jgi:hypothetical protein
MLLFNIRSGIYFLLIERVKTEPFIFVFMFKFNVESFKAIFVWLRF